MTNLPVCALISSLILDGEIRVWSSPDVCQKLKVHVHVHVPEGLALILWILLIPGTGRISIQGCASLTSVFISSSDITCTCIRLTWV